MSALRVESEDDILAFLPQDNPEVRTFYDINTRFGGLDVGLVGIETDNPFRPEFLERLRRVTRELQETRGLNSVLSLANVNDFTADPLGGGIVAAPLLGAIPTTPAMEDALREKVFARENVVSNLISENGRAVLIYCFLSYGTDPKVISAQIREVVSAGFPHERIAWGGNPFISSYVYSAVQGDLRKLTPWAALVIVLLMVLALRDVVATLLALSANGLAIAATIGLMAVFGVKLNLMLGSAPVVLFAVGCTYSIHLLLRYLDLRRGLDVPEAIAGTLTGIGPAITVAGVTSAAAISSYVVMDIQPIREFGLFTALGIVLTMLYSLTFVPAALRLIGLTPRPQTRGGDAVRRGMVKLALFAADHRLAVGGVLGVLTAVGALFVARIQTGVDQRSFFSAGSPPDQADEFLRRNFGAAQFAQIQVVGDLREPEVLREIEHLADRIGQIPHVSGVQHIAQVVATLNEAMTGQRRIPDTREQVQNLNLFLTGDPAVAQLATEDRSQALLQVKIDTADVREVGGVLEAIGAVITGERLGHYALERLDGPRGMEVRARHALELRARLESLVRPVGLELPRDAGERIDAYLKAAQPEVDPTGVAGAIERFLRSAECAVALPPPQRERDPARAVAQAVVALGRGADGASLARGIAQALGRSPEDAEVQDLQASLGTPLEEIWARKEAEQRSARLAGALGLTPPAGPAGERFLGLLGLTALDASRPTAILPAPDVKGAPGLKIAVSGLPVLHRGLARSVERNQLQSLVFAVLLVILLLALLFRSFWTGLMAAVPTLFTLVIVHGAMGLLGINLDIGTSLLGSLILANGIDYAVHLIASWRSDSSLREGAAQSAGVSGPAIWTSAVAMFIGFFVLTLGEARPLQTVTGLKAAAMLIGALASFLIIPILARRLGYNLIGDSHPLPQVEENPEVFSALMSSQDR